MAPSPSSQLYVWFDKALDMAPREREAFLREIESEDASTGAELRSLIQRFEHESSALDEPLTPRFAKFLDMDEKDFWESPTEIKGDEIASGNGTAKDVIPEKIGPYPILHRIGEGGMGTVFLARQLNPEREVALKVIHQDRLPQSARARFEAEYRVLALMNHHHIARNDPALFQRHEARLLGIEHSSRA